MDEIISYKMCAVKLRNAKLRNYLKYIIMRNILQFNVKFNHCIKLNLTFIDKLWVWNKMISNSRMQITLLFFILNFNRIKKGNQ
jgi:hypothetical protein